MGQNRSLFICRKRIESIINPWEETVFILIILINKLLFQITDIMIIEVGKLEMYESWKYGLFFFLCKKLILKMQ